MVRSSSSMNCLTCSSISGWQREGDGLSLPGHNILPQVILGHTMIVHDQSTGVKIRDRALEEGKVDSI